MTQQLTATTASATTMLPTSAHYKQNGKENKHTSLVSRNFRRPRILDLCLLGCDAMSMGCVVTKQCLHLQGTTVHDDGLLLKMEALRAFETERTTSHVT
jgi:hypothetical protein